MTVVTRQTALRTGSDSTVVDRQFLWRLIVARKTELIRRTGQELRTG
jgi:hypothetical protein